MENVNVILGKCLYNRSGMMCDPAFVDVVVSDWLEVFGVDDLRLANTSVDVHYDGTFEVVSEDYSTSGKNHIVVKVYPVTDEGNKTIDECVCGEAWIDKGDWDVVIGVLESMSDD